MTRLSEVVEDSFMLVLQIMLEADPGLRDERDEDGGRSPISYGLEVGGLQAVQRLLDRGADINKRDPQGVYPLLVACCKGSVEVVSFVQSSFGILVPDGARRGPCAG